MKNILNIFPIFLLQFGIIIKLSGINCHCFLFYLKICLRVFFKTLFNV